MIPYMSRVLVDTADRARARAMVTVFLFFSSCVRGAETREREMADADARWPRACVPPAAPRAAGSY